MLLPSDDKMIFPLPTKINLKEFDAFWLKPLFVLCVQNVVVSELEKNWEKCEKTFCECIDFRVLVKS